VRVHQGEAPGAPSAEIGTPVGVVEELWRYPVKSMLGEQPAEVTVTPRGIVGDRAWALRDLTTGRIASAKRFPRLLEMRAAFSSEPVPGSAAGVVIDLPGGRYVMADDPDASAIVSDLLGHPMRMESLARAQEVTGIDPATVFGDVPVEVMKPEWTPGRVPDHFTLKPTSFLEIGPLFILTSASVEHVRRLRGPDAVIDRRRFRPNVYVATPPADAFIEERWRGGEVAVGGDVVLGKLEPTLWCVTSTLAQQDLPRDIGVLRTIATHNRGCLGVYATPVTTGVVRVGDAVALSPPRSAAGPRTTSPPAEEP
jgi:uncharacterized protein YcbX